MSGVCTEQDDEFSIAMIAFHEAIQSYSRTRGSFLHYASILIKNRLIDYHRKESRHQGHLSLHEKIDDDGTELHEHIAYEVDHYEETVGLSATKQEVEELSHVMEASLQPSEVNRKITVALLMPQKYGCRIWGKLQI